MTTVENTPFDALTVTKGPEDGEVLPLVASPIQLGRDPACDVGPRLDVTVQPFHARLSVDRGGYRVRRLTGAPVLVGGKRTGRILSRTLRSGQILRVGYTELMLRCAPQGLAATSRPKWTESDFAWGLWFVGIALVGAGRRLFVGVYATMPFLFRHWLLLGAVLFLAACVLVPELRHFLTDAWSRIRAGIGQ